MTTHPTDFDPATVNDDKPWNGDVYRVTIEAVVECNSPAEAQYVTAMLLAGRGPEIKHFDITQLNGFGSSWAPNTKRVELIRQYRNGRSVDVTTEAGAH